MHFPEKPETELDLTHVHQLLCNLPADSSKTLSGRGSFLEDNEQGLAQGRSKEELQIHQYPHLESKF